MGEVWRGTDTMLGRQVAVKTIDLQPARQRNAGEPASAARRARPRCSNHPHVVTVYDTGVEGDTAYLVMELLPGPSLAEALRARAAAGRRGRARIGLAGGSARSHAAHDAGIVHRDIKPANIVLCRRRHASRCSTSASPSSSTTRRAPAADRDAPSWAPPSTSPPSRRRAAGRAPRRPLRPGLRAHALLAGQAAVHRADAGRDHDEARARRAPTCARAPRHPGWLADLVTACSPRTPAHRPQSGARSPSLLRSHRAPP